MWWLQGHGSGTREAVSFFSRGQRPSGCVLLVGPMRSEGCQARGLWRSLQEPCACPVGEQREQSLWHCTPRTAQ